MPRLFGIMWKVMIVVFAVIAIIVILPVLDNGISQRLDYPKIDLSEFGASANCAETETGWKCSFTTQDEMFDRTVSDIYKQSCNEQGGVWKCYGYCINSYDHYCDFMFSDAQSACIASWQCGGKCISQGGPFGECSKYALRHCDTYSEFSYGIVSENYVLCD